MYLLKDRINFQHWGLCQFFSFHLPICKKLIPFSFLCNFPVSKYSECSPHRILSSLFYDHNYCETQNNQIITPSAHKYPSQTSCLARPLLLLLSLLFYWLYTHTLRNTHLVFAPSQQREAPGGGDPSQWQRRRAEAVAEQSCVAVSLPFETTLSVIHTGDTQALWGTVWFYSYAFFKSFVKTHQCFRKWTKGNLFLWQPCITESIHALLL